MQHEAHTHGINMSALGRDKQSLNLEQETVAIEVPGLSLYYGDKQALFDVSMNIPKQRVTAFIGPSGCGKSTLLRTFNRMNDLVDGCRVEGAINLYGTNIYRKGEDVAEPETGRRADAVGVQPDARDLALRQIGVDVLAVHRRRDQQRLFRRRDLEDDGACQAGFALHATAAKVASAGHRA